MEFMDIKAIRMAVLKLEGDFKSLKEAIELIHKLGDQPEHPVAVRTKEEYEKWNLDNTTYHHSKRKYEENKNALTEMVEGRKKDLIKAIPPNMWVEYDPGLWIGYYTSSWPMYQPYLEFAKTNVGEIPDRILKHQND